MFRLFLTILITVMLIPACLPALEGEGAEVEVTLSDTAAADTAQTEEAPVDTIPIVRRAFRGDSDQHRNFATLESRAPLQTTLLLTSAINGYVLVRADSVADSLVLKLDIDLTQLTTGYPERDSLVFSHDFLDFDTATVATLNLVRVTKAEEKELVNEQTGKYVGVAELWLGGVIDTVSVTFEMTYLEGNKVTETRLPGHLLHLTVNSFFRLSDFGVKIPKAALLKLDDRIALRVDIFTAFVEEIVQEP
ncbi:MAG: YceI family protein [candidate division Zixibacteria bacterium]|nr:YceI family protein [candidate division Zixibacteria bacterium]